jgi:hypothetical protein
MVGQQTQTPLEHFPTDRNQREVPWHHPHLASPIKGDEQEVCASKALPLDG